MSSTCSSPAATRRRAPSSKNSERAAQVLGNTNDRLKGDVTEIVDRLAKSNDMLNGLLNGAESNLLRIETSLSSRATEFGRSIDQAVETTQLSSEELAGQVDKLTNVSRDILNGVAGVVTDSRRRASR